MKMVLCVCLLAVAAFDLLDYCLLHAFCGAAFIAAFHQSIACWVLDRSKVRLAAFDQVMDAIGLLRLIK
jgi:hypothetical protein